jgi:protein associated with RNAse G/E
MFSDDKKITICSFKFDKSLNYEWDARIIDINDNYVVTLAQPGRVMQHHRKKKQLVFENWSMEFILFNEWFTANLSFNDEYVHYYCNVCMPAVLDNKKIKFIDLDLDYINFDGNWKVVDEDEFEENKIKYSYPKELIAKTYDELEKLKKRVSNKKIPFDKTFEKYFSQNGIDIKKKIKY